MGTFRRHLIILAAVALLASACGGDDTATPDAETDGDAVATSTVAEATDAPEPTEAGVQTEASDATEDATEDAAAADGTAGDAAAGDCTGSIGLLGPFTGDAASIGQEQLNWATFALDRFNEENGTDLGLVEGDTQLDPAQATTVAQQVVSDSSVLALVGPAGSQEVEAIAPILDGGLAMISASATSTDLTEGDIEGFFRVIPRDDVQGPTIADFILESLDGQNVVIIDDQTSYSTGLAASATETLEEGGATVSSDSVSQDQTDFSSLVTGIGEDVDVVFLPWQIAANAQLFAQQMTEQGKDATIIGGDGLFSPEDFSAEGAYVSSFAPDVRGIESAADLVETYEAEYGDFGTFGPPVFAATEVAATAILAACEDGAPDREGVLAQVGEVTLEDSILGAELSFDDKGDVEGAQFYIFVIEGGEYTLVE